jgi:hypothetical protein
VDSIGVGLAPLDFSIRFSLRSFPFFEMTFI